ncbi:polygalacturonase At1g48100-like [Arachis duranensis]|uniref:Polygalacturonase At1g48100-like n=1 Tax=Arachis duranensis TaxID=130453 RepID=A0A6P4DFN5_ARADU|nr:polygalacturonase At1g48100-like [Arachis duranensis]
MKSMKICTFTTLMIVIVFCVLCSSFESCSAIRGYNHHFRKLKATSSAASPSSSNDNNTFNVLDYGAKGDGKADDTKAFEDAWADTCKTEGSTMIVPSGSEFLVKPISFSGPNCEQNIVFQLDGKIIAPTDSESWGSGTLQWMEFTKLNKITIKGKGVIDGQGSVWWNNNDSPTYIPTEEESTTSSQYSVQASNENLPSQKPTALRFYGSDGVTVAGITIQNSQQTHLKFDSCSNVQVFDINVLSPADSPNTDGIHLRNSQTVLIYSSTLACGDDCVSIQNGCSNILIHDLSCGPSHGISIGGLGKDGTKACVSNVTVRDTSLQNSLTAVRIKTWQGGSGSVQDVMFSNIQVSDVETPIMIDQYYCDGGKCKNDTSSVAVSAIHYVNIKGTYTKEPLHFACSDNIPCTGLTLDTINLQESTTQNAKSDSPFCWQAYGELKTKTVPPVTCLDSGNPPNKGINSNSDSC